MSEILEKIKNKQLIRRGNKLYTKVEIQNILDAEEQVETAEMRQMSKKLTLKF